MVTAVLVALTACNSAPQSDPVPPPASDSKEASSTTSATPTSVKPTRDAAEIKQANQRTCDNFQSQVATAGLDVLLTEYNAADTSPASFSALRIGVQKLEPFKLDPKSASDVQGPILDFFFAGRTFNDATSPIEPAKTYVASYSAAVEACSDFITTKPVTYSVECSGTKFSNFRDAWPQTPKSCDGIPTGGTELTDVQKTALSAAGSTTRSTLKTLYGLCGQVGAYPANIQSFALGRLSDAQVQEARGMLALCPDHPDAAQIQANIDAAGPAAAAASAAASESARAEADGEIAKPGKHLVGPDIRPGTWQSVGDRVEDCYWETSDSTGEIIDNNFISVAPQFTITIPSSAAGFTNSGCTFKRIGD